MVQTYTQTKLVKFCKGNCIWSIKTKRKHAENIMMRKDMPHIVRRKASILEFQNGVKRCGVCRILFILSYGKSSCFCCGNTLTATVKSNISRTKRVLKRY